MVLYLRWLFSEGRLQAQVYGYLPLFLGLLVLGIYQELCLLCGKREASHSVHRAVLIHLEICWLAALILNFPLSIAVAEFHCKECTYLVTPPRGAQLMPEHMPDFVK